MTVITHQDIIDRLEKLGKEHGAAYAAEQARQRKERASLQELCGGIGHLYAKSDWLNSVLARGRSCVFCKMYEPMSAAESAG